MVAFAVDDPRDALCKILIRLLAELVVDAVAEEGLGELGWFVHVALWVELRADRVEDLVDDPPLLPSGLAQYLLFPLARTVLVFSLEITLC